MGGQGPRERGRQAERAQSVRARIPTMVEMDGVLFLRKWSRGTRGLASVSWSGWQSSERLRACVNRLIGGETVDDKWKRARLDASFSP